MIFRFLPFAADGVLSGSILGQKVFAALAQEVTPPTAATVVFLDFTDVEVATASFLRESVVAFRNHARVNWSFCYPVASNLSANVREELSDILKAQGDAMASCDLDANGEIHNAAVLGHLDVRQARTISAAVATGEVDAPTLSSQFSDDQVGPTAWNNRLTFLAGKGLLIERSVGRGKRYRTVLEGLKYGT